ncbi:MAG TPA: TlyA family RNA methyltransferase [Giesbergeria sp.]|nr:TlyA family RNA methyltransferase [Giesbergeria sp.]
MRADVFLVESGLASTRSQAQRLIASGVQWRLAASAPWNRVVKNGDEIPAGAEVHLLDEAEARFVSRGGLKLEGALRHVGLSVQDLQCLDVGQSTGGFTHCLLEHGARRVVGVEVGHGQLHAQLREDARVVCLEGINARALTPASLQEAWEAAGSEMAPQPQEDDAPPDNPYRWMSGDGEVSDYDDSDDVSDDEVEAELARSPAPQAPSAAAGAPRRRIAVAVQGIDPVFDLVTGDLSFISLTLVLPALVPLLAPGGQLLMLVKPQFELQPGQVGKGGVVRDTALYAVVEQRIRACCADVGLAVQDWFDSPIAGGDGNREFFVFARKAA